MRNNVYRGTPMAVRGRQDPCHGAGNLLLVGLGSNDLACRVHGHEVGGIKAAKAAAFFNVRVDPAQ
jgi:hypothetical protein